MTYFKREIQFHIVRPITPCLVASIMMIFTTTLYCDILGYDAVQFGVCFLLKYIHKIMVSIWK
jgi:hypothetical protein